MNSRNGLPRTMVFARIEDPYSFCLSPCHFPLTSYKGTNVYLQFVCTNIFISLLFFLKQKAREINALLFKNVALVFQVKV